MWKDVLLFGHSLTRHTHARQREYGEVVGDDMEHPALVEVEKEYGRPLAELIVAKKREVERYCPSGYYPTPVRRGRLACVCVCVCLCVPMPYHGVSGSDTWARHPRRCCSRATASCGWRR
jgi:hypothetical protein